MAFISEVNFLGGASASNPEYVEITLGPNDDPADFTVSAYDENGDLDTTSGISGGEVTLDTLTGSPDPENSDFTVYVIYVGIRNSVSDGDEASGIALTDTSADGGVVAFYSAASQSAITATEGAASGVTSDNLLNHRVLSTGESYQWDIYGNLTIGDKTPGDAVVCLAGSAQVRTISGLRRAETLSEGDLVWTADHGYQTIRWIGTSRLEHSDFMRRPHCRPIRLAKNAICENMPSSDLEVSPQHRILMRSKICQRMFGSSEGFVAAKKLLEFAGVEIASDIKSVTYVHLLFDHHEVIAVNGAYVESLLIAEQSEKIIARGGVMANEPLRNVAGDQTLPHMIPCRKILTGKPLKRFIYRHQKNRCPLWNAIGQPISMGAAI